MHKHTLPALMVAAAIVVTGVLGSMQRVSADTIIVEPLGKGSITHNDNKLIASNAGSSDIVIEIVPENPDREKKDSSVEAGSADSVKKGSIAGIAYDKLVMANVEEAVNIRDASSEDGKLVGKLYKECGGEILDRANGWTKLKTGDVTGWVRNDFLLFGDDAISLAEKSVEKTATCNADCLRVRKSADPNGTVLDLLAQGDQIEVVANEGDWVKVEYSDGDIGYVSSEFVTVSDNLGCGRSIEDINAQEAAEKAAKLEAEAAKNSAKSASKESSGSGASETKASSDAGAIANVSAAGFSDQVLLAALIQAESGTQPFEGQVAVGNVVMNRLATGKYGSSIYSVIYAKSQFGPAGSGQVAQIAAKGPKASCMQAAQAAMSGVNYIGPATHFRNVNSGNQGIVIGAHVFW